VNRSTTIGRLVALVVIAALVLAPVLLSVGATAMQMPAAMSGAHAGMTRAGMTMSADEATSSDAAMPSDMECCPKKASHMPDCGKDCPFMALCMGIGLQQGDRVASLCAPMALMSTLIPGSQGDLDGFAQAPPTRPPKI
jgi:hypothetical protein